MLTCTVFRVQFCKYVLLNVGARPQHLVGALAQTGRVLLVIFKPGRAAKKMHASVLRSDVLVTYETASSIPLKTTLQALTQLRNFANSRRFPYSPNTVGSIHRLLYVFEWWFHRNMSSYFTKHVSSLDRLLSTAMPGGLGSSVLLLGWRLRWSSPAECCCRPWLSCKMPRSHDHQQIWAGENGYSRRNC